MDSGTEEATLRIGRPAHKRTKNHGQGKRIPVEVRGSAYRLRFRVRRLGRETDISVTTDSLAEAERAYEALLDLRRRGRHDILVAIQDGKLTVQQADAALSAHGRHYTVEELIERSRPTEIDLRPFVVEWLEELTGTTPPRARRRARTYGPETHRRYEASWLQVSRYFSKADPALKRFTANGGPILASQLTHHWSVDYRKQRTSGRHKPRWKKRVSDATINRDFLAITSFWTWMRYQRAQDPDEYPKLPELKLRLQPEEQPDWRGMKPEHLERIQRELHAAFQAITVVIADTGLRVSEAQSLQVRDVDLEKRFLLIRDRYRPRDADKPRATRPNRLKSRTSERIVPFSETRIALLRRLISEAGDGETAFLFKDRARNYDSYRRAFRKACLAAGLKHPEPSASGGEKPLYTIHSLRHTFGNRASRTIDPLTVMRVMGHSTLDTTRIYIDGTPDESVYKDIGNQLIAPITEILTPERTQTRVTRRRNGVKKRANYIDK